MKNIVDTTDTYYIENIYRDIELLLDRYNDILTKQIIGHSVEGRDIISLKLSINNNKKAKLLITGGIHAREDYSVMLVMKMIETYCEAYRQNTFVEEFDTNTILSATDIYFIPTANPDGLNIIHHGLNASKNYDILKDMFIHGEDYTYWKANSRGVDINKNFDDGNFDIRICVEGTDKPCSDRFKGYSANSEPETKALVDFCIKEQFDLMATYHCSGNCTFWADSGTHAMFRDVDTKIMDEIADRYIYRKTKISPDPAIYGCGFENYFRARMKRPAFCIELSPYQEGGKQNPDSEFENLVWPYAKSMGLFFAQKADEIKDIVFTDSLSKAAITIES